MKASIRKTKTPPILGIAMLACFPLHALSGEAKTPRPPVETGAVTYSVTVTEESSEGRLSQASKSSVSILRGASSSLSIRGDTSPLVCIQASTGCQDTSFASLDVNLSISPSTLHPDETLASLSVRTRQARGGAETESRQEALFRSGADAPMVLVHRRPPTHGAVLVEIVRTGAPASQKKEP